MLEPGESLADASLWADENRGRLPKTAPWHYVDVPLDEPRYDARFSGDVPTKGCVVDKINEFRLVDQGQEQVDRGSAVRAAVPHPLHRGHAPAVPRRRQQDKGGNQTQVRFFDRGTNMHRLWDSGMIERAGNTEEFWLADLAELDTRREPRRMDEGDGRGLGDGELCWRPAKPTRMPETGKRIKPGRSWAMPTWRRTCRSCGGGSIRRGCGWRGCSMRRFGSVDSRFR